MASHLPAAMAPPATDKERLSKAWEDLGAVNEKLRLIQLECDRLMDMDLYSQEGPNSWGQAVREGFITLTEDERKQDELDGDTLVLIYGREYKKRGVLIDELEVSRSDLRRLINELSRPYLRRLNILNLPDELLLEIFEYLELLDVIEPVAPPLIRRRGNEIKNTRLVCRRFCQLSSSLHLRVVRVSFTEASLARLEEISRHPTISKGVRTVKVDLRFYNEDLKDFNTFIDYHEQELGEEINLGGRVLRVVAQMPEEEASEMIKKRTCHRRYAAEYVARLKEQQSLIRKGNFPRALASAIARMPGARDMAFKDSLFDVRDRLMMPGSEVSWDQLRRRMLQPMSGGHAMKHRLERPDYQCVVDLIESVRLAGVSLSGIDISLWPPLHKMPRIPSDFRASFVAGMQQLKQFRFCYHGYPVVQEEDNLHDFLSAFVGTSSLQKLDLDIGPVPIYGPSPSIDLDRILGPGPRHNLKDFSLHYVAIDLSKLLLILKRLPDSVYHLGLDSIELRSGTWEEALERLQEKKPRTMSLRSPYGAETFSMPQPDYETIFSTEYYDKRTVTENYITGHFSLNPFQALQNGYL
ncbi:uncharacterized protein B0T15DRAFT_557105 [Chaetomium strumarium]|uniref:F-box domain-containing protein n=1 Tax=Chaetomium strumarium TaxID=1170767 RepID=A0AAJ0M240_9PEZI|nr:hypothetical protein B0T15DRAFT_557105 [Chaetomium strumarium]